MSTNYLQVLQRDDTGAVQFRLAESTDYQTEVPLPGTFSVRRLGVVSGRTAATLRDSLCEELSDCEVYPDWFELTPTKLLGLLNQLSFKDGFSKGEDPYIPVRSIKSVRDVQILACLGLLPVATSEDTGEYVIDWDEYGYVHLALTNKEHGDDVWKLSAEYNGDKSFKSSTWSLYQTYTGCSLDVFSDRLDVRELVDPDRIQQFA